jgi:hypothetical protein
MTARTVLHCCLNTHTKRMQPCMAVVTLKRSLSLHIYIFNHNALLSKMCPCLLALHSAPSEVCSLDVDWGGRRRLNLQQPPGNTLILWSCMYRAAKQQQGEHRERSGPWTCAAPPVPTAALVLTPHCSTRQICRKQLNSLFLIGTVQVKRPVRNTEQRTRI